MSPVAGRSHTPNFSRPGAVQAPSAAPAIAASHPGRTEAILNTVKGLQGASDAIRGTVNGTIAHSRHDRAEEERQRAIRDQGINDFRVSGLKEQAGVLREGFRQKAEERNRLRRRSGSVQRPQIGHTLDRVEER